jgi:competence protein ComEA
MMWANRFRLSDLLAVAGTVVALVAAGVVVVRANRPPVPVRITAAEPDPVIKVHVAGEVVWPGLYILNAGSRVQDAIRAAHGLTYAADLTRVNLAAPAGEPMHTVNVNTATAADLERLPGVGPVLARRIVEQREAKGLFRQLDDLLQVKGIGPRLLARLRPRLSLD